MNDNVEMLKLLVLDLDRQIKDKKEYTTLKRNNPNIIHEFQLQREFNIKKPSDMKIKETCKMIRRLSLNIYNKGE